MVVLNSRFIFTVIVFLSFSFSSWAGICDRSPEITMLISEEVGKNCKEVDLEDLSNIESLDFTLAGLSELWPGDFSGLSHLKELDLARNALKTLPPDIFKGLGELQILRLDSNHLAALPEGLFSDLTALRELYLGGNPLEVVPEGAFDKLSKLEGLRFANTRLKSLPNNIFVNLRQLLELDLNGDELAPGSLAQLRTWRHFICSCKIPLCLWAHCFQELHSLKT